MQPHTTTGYVYILTNDSFREDWVKIGKSARAVNVRSKELDNTAVPLPFEIYATLETTKYHDVEKMVHKFIDRLTDLRIRQNREFFNVAPDVALAIFQDIASVLDDAVITLYKNNEPVGTWRPSQPAIEVAAIQTPPTPSPRRQRFRFQAVGLQIGQTLTFIPTGQQVTIASDDKVEYEGRLYSLSAFTGTFMPSERHCPSGAYQGPKFFSFEGESLLARRLRLERHSTPSLAHRPVDTLD